jgi:hypothetical protein
VCVKKSEAEKQPATLHTKRFVVVVKVLSTAINQSINRSVNHRGSSSSKSNRSHVARIIIVSIHQELVVQTIPAMMYL